MYDLPVRYAAGFVVSLVRSSPVRNRKSASHNVQIASYPTGKWEVGGGKVPVWDRRARKISIVV